VNWIVNNTDLIVELTLLHLRLSILPIVLGFLIAIPLGWLAWRYRLTKGILLTVVSVLYTVPSLALLILLPGIVGYPLISNTNLTVALTIYAVALMTRSAADGFAAVDQDVRQSATALGYSGLGRFFAVEFPLAGPVLLAGLRVVAVSTVSLITVGVLVGIQSLGYLFTNGLQRFIFAEILTGIVMVVLIALVLDRLLVLLGRVLMPWTRTGTRAARRVQLTVPAAG
jgi:osmoprotectant transport system permease protein